jgi:hypothetical protein
VKPSEAALPAPPDRTDLFSEIVLRDGFGPEDAYLMLQGFNPILDAPVHEPFGANSIPRYTELGSLLLFHHSRLQTSWVRNVVSSSRGQHDPHSAVCLLEGNFDTPTVAAVRSLLAEAGGVSWRRSIFRRRGGYFVVLDEMTPKDADTCHFTCRWRSYHPGTLVNPREFRATDPGNGTQLRLMAAAPVVQQVRLEPMDGAAEPTVLRQFKTAQLEPGQTVSFQNLLYATNAKADRDFAARRLTDHAVLVKGRSKQFAELAAMGTENFGALKSVAGEGRLWYVSDRTLAVSGAERLRLKDCFTAECPAGFDLELTSGDERNVLCNPGSKAIGITFRVEPGSQVKLAGRTLKGEGRVSLRQGEHGLEIGNLPAWFQKAKQELAQLWPRTEIAAAAPPELAPPKLDCPDPWREVWRFQGLEPPLRKHRYLKASAEPPPTVGTPDSWVDRNYGGTHRQPLAFPGWNKGAGAVILDLGRQTDIDSIRLIGFMGEFEAWKKGGASFEILLSDDNFVKDIRKLAVPEPRFEIYRISLARLWIYHLPSFVLPVGQRARQVRIVTSWPGYKRPVTFGEIEVVTAQREPRVATELLAANFFGPHRPGLLAGSGRQLVMLAPDGKKIWDRQLPTELLILPCADVDSDGRTEILAFTEAEKLYAFNSDESLRFKHDLRGQGKVTFGRAEGGGFSTLTPPTVGVWRPDDQGKLEYYFFPHCGYGRITPEPELKQTNFPGPGAKYAFPVPDLDGDGREELGLASLWTWHFNVIGSRSDLANGKIDYLLDKPLPLTGYSCGNDELPNSYPGIYYDGASVCDGQGKLLGAVVLNPGGIDFFKAPDFSPGWAHFNHAPNTCSALIDLAGDGTAELVVGREDGYVTGYAVSDGKVLGTVFAGGPVRALAPLGNQVAVATERGLVLLDKQLRIVGCRPGPACALAVLSDPAAKGRVLVAALDTGELVALRKRLGAATK